MYKIAVATLLVFVSFLASAQICAPGHHTWPNCKLIEDAKRVVSLYATIKPPTQQANKTTQELMNAFFILGEEGFDQRLDTMDDSWYSGLDAYLYYDRKELIRMIKKDTKARFRLYKTATITVADDGENYLIVVYSF